MAACIPTLSPTARLLTALRGAGFLSLCLLGTLAATSAQAQSLSSLTVKPGNVVATATATGTVTLSSNAPAGGITVSLSSNNGAAQVPASVLVAAGTNSKTFNVTTSVVSVQQSAIITASYNGVNRTATVNVYVLGTRLRLSDLGQLPSSMRFDWNGPTLSGNSVYLWGLVGPAGTQPTNYLSGSTGSPSVTTTGMSVDIDSTYNFTVTERVAWFDPSAMQWMFSDVPLGTVTFTPKKLTVQDNQAVDARYDLRYSTYTLLNHNFGTTAYRGGLFVGNAPAPDQSRMSRTFLRFPTLSLSAGTSIWCDSVHLYFNGAVVTNTTGWTVAIQPVAETGWTIGDLTWSSAPAMNPADVTNGIATIKYDTANPSAYQGWKHWTLTRLAGMLAAGLNPCVGFAVSTESTDQTNGVNSWLYFAKKEYDSNKAPYLLYAIGNAPIAEVYVYFSPASTVQGGQSVTATVCLNGITNVPTVVNLSSSDPHATVPASVTIPANQGSASFTVTTTSVTTTTSVQIVAGANLAGTAAYGILTLTP